MIANVILHTIKYFIVTLLVWGAMRISNVNFSFLSCSMVGWALAILEWQFKVWMIEQMETAARQTIHVLKNKS